MQRRYLTAQNETLVVRFIVIVVAYFILRSIIKRAAKDATQEQVAAGDVNALIAVEMRQAMNPSGSAWFMSFDGTEVETLFNSARKCTDFSQVSRAYKNLYNADLINDVQDELSTTDFAQFQALLGIGGAKGYYYSVAEGVPAYEVLNVDLNKQPIGNIGSVIKAYKLGERIDGDFVQELGKGSESGSTFLLFKDTNFWFFDYYYVIEAKNLILR